MTDFSRCASVNPIKKSEKSKQNLSITTIIDDISKQFLKLFINNKTTQEKDSACVDLDDDDYYDYYEEREYRDSF